MRGRLDLLLTEISNNPNSSAIIYTRGTPDQIAVRTRYWKNQMVYRQFDASRIKFISGRNVGHLQTDIWLIPAGAAPPEIKPEAWIFKELGRTTKTAVTKTMSDADKNLRKLGDHQLYVINYGTPAQIAQREKWIRDSITFRRFDSYRITLVNGGNSGRSRTIMWLVPPGAENPIP
jgi:hypothetical protein